MKRVSWVNNCVFRKNPLTALPALFSVKKGPTVKTWVSSYSPKQEELENLSLVAVLPRNCELWPFVHVTSKRLFAFNVSTWNSTLFVVMKESRRNNLPSNPFLSSWRT